MSNRGWKEGRHWLLYLLMPILLLALSLVSLGVGYVDMSPLRLLQGTWDGELLASRILLELRVPRTALCLLVGAVLGLAGAALQGLLRNPLAEPSLLGVSSGAALGAVLALYSGFADAFALALPLAGLLGTALALGIVFALAGRGSSSNTLVLAGVAVSSLFGALIALTLNWAKTPTAVSEIVFWMMGSLADRSNHELLLATPFMLVGALLLLRCRRGLAALSLGEETAHSLGVNLGRLRTLVLLGTACCVGAAVSVAGTIGFIGLVAPHLMRPLVRGDAARLLPASALAGAILLTLADLGVRLMHTQTAELKLGVLTSLVGAPFFLLLILRHRSQDV